MRKLKIFGHISLDGVIQVRGSGEDGDYPYGDWTAPYRRCRPHGLSRKSCRRSLASGLREKHPARYQSCGALSERPCLWLEKHLSRRDYKKGAA